MTTDKTVLAGLQSNHPRHAEHVAFPSSQSQSHFSNSDRQDQPNPLVPAKSAKSRKRLDSNDIQLIQSSRFLQSNPLMVQDAAGSNPAGPTTRVLLPQGNQDSTFFCILQML